MEDRATGVEKRNSENKFIAVFVLADMENLCSARGLLLKVSLSFSDGDPWDQDLWDLF